MKDVVIRQYVRPDGLPSHKRMPELVIGGNPTEMVGVRRIEGIIDASDVSTVRITFIARLETIVEEEFPPMCGCGHPPHVGLICGIPYKLNRRVFHCECEG